jgi:predicted MFS family arabinose efflux permease
MTSTRRDTSGRSTEQRGAAWLSVGFYGVFLATLQLPWLTYAPSTAAASRAFGVSEGAVGDLAVVTTVCYVVLGIPSGQWLDRWFRHTLVVGTVLSIAGVLVRAIDPQSYAWAMSGQLVMSIGSPLVLNAITKLPARHFTSTQRTAAVSILSASQFTGILLAASTGPWLMSHGIDVLVVTHALVVTAAGVAFLGSLRIPSRYPAGTSFASAAEVIRKNRVLLPLAALLFMGFGLFDAFATWIDSIESDLGNPGVGALLVTMITIGGVAGAATLPALAARLGCRRELLILIGVVNALIIPALIVVREPLLLAVLAALLGFLLFSGMPTVLDWSEEISGREHAGAVAGFLIVVGNIGGTSYVLILQGVLGHPHVAVLLLTALVTPWVLVARRIAPAPATAQTEEVLA